MEIGTTASLEQAPTAPTSRRGLLAAVTAGLFAAWQLADGATTSEAKKKRKRKRKETSVALLDVPAGISTVSFSFPDPPAVAASREYALVLSKGGPRSVLWRGQEGDTCDGQGFRRKPGAERFEVLSDGKDFIFTTLVRS